MGGITIEVDESVPLVELVKQVFKGSHDWVSGDIQWYSFKEEIRIYLNIEPPCKYLVSVTLFHPGVQIYTQEILSQISASNYSPLTVRQLCFLSLYHPELQKMSPIAGLGSSTEKGGLYPFLCHAPIKPAGNGLVLRQPSAPWLDTFRFAAGKL